MFSLTRWWAWLCAAGLLALIGGCSGTAGRHPMPVSDDEESRPLPAPMRSMTALPVANVAVDATETTGPLDTFRHTLGHGGINSNPLPPRVVDGVAKLHPRLIRIFIQEFFFVYPDHNVYDWSKLDPYMDSLAQTGANVVAAITIKPKPLFPKLDQNIWQPNNPAEWQQLIAALVKRYSVDKPIVTYWEIGNETDIGENGGCPYLIPDPAQYAEYYKMTIEPILKTFPKAKVGGPAVANASSDYIARFVDACAKQKLPLDFISWHLYSDDVDSHAQFVLKYRKIVDQFLGKRPEMLVTEWNKGFDPISVEEIAFDPRRAAIAASAIIAMLDAGLDWSFYYHLQDQVAYMPEFQPFFQNPDIMYHHWNEVPHRFGLFGVGQEPRPQYFVYQLLSRMGNQRLRADSDQKDLRILASRGDSSTALMLVNLGHPSQDRLANLRLTNLTPGRKLIRTWRIDRTCSWSPRSLELLPLETRQTDVRPNYSFQVYSPADSVTFVTLEDQK